MIRVPAPPAAIAAELRADVPLAPYAAYELGGTADLFFEANSESHLIMALEWAKTHKIPFFVLGSGTNMLIRDGGMRGLVVYLGPRTRTWKIEVTERTDTYIRLHVPGAFSKSELLDWSLAQGAAGLEFSAGIPGTIGGAVYMNAGTRWGSYEKVIETVRLWSPTEGVIEKLASEMGFKYRGHGEALAGGAVVLSADLKLKLGPEAAQSRALVDRILSYRGSRQALERPSCGSVFKNPENSSRGAGRLIESAGLKGTRRGGAQLSTKHANFLLNRGNCKAADVEELVLLAQTQVKNEFGILLEPEVIIRGEHTRIDANVYSL